MPPASDTTPHSPVFSAALLNALSSPRHQAARFKKKNKVKKKRKKKPSVTNLCSLFLLIFPPTISSTLSFQVSWSTAPWLRGNLVPFRVPTECVSSKGAAAVAGGRVAKKKKAQ